MAVDPLSSTSGLKVVSARAGDCVCNDETRTCTESPWKVFLAKFRALGEIDDEAGTDGPECCQGRL